MAKTSRFYFFVMIIHIFTKFAHYRFVIKNIENILKIFIFIAMFFVGALLVLCFPKTSIFAYGRSQNVYKIDCDGKVFEFDLNCKNFCSKFQEQIFEKTPAEKLKIIDKILEMGFDFKTAINYVYPNFKQQLDCFAENVNVLHTDAVVISLKNCKIDFKNEKNGQIIDKNDFYLRFYENFYNKDIIKIAKKIDEPQVFASELKKHFIKCGEFSTNYKSSGMARKNNIKTACNAIDGILIKAGEVFSFNAATGCRTDERGYQSAKIIVGGKYVDGVGGGVCQVSTTLYNAALLSGLDIVEVHNHTLPVSYVMPCFDAMVNVGSADLKIKNNTGEDYFITAHADGELCRVVIYGNVPDCKIVRRFKKGKILPSLESEYCYDTTQFDGNFAKGENIVSQGADGYQAQGFLDYYRDGILIKTKQIREDTYLPKKKIVLVVE